MLSNLKLLGTKGIDWVFSIPDMRGGRGEGNQGTFDYLKLRRKGGAGTATHCGGPGQQREGDSG